MLEFRQRILFVGFGAVARCTIPILVKHINVAPRITIIDFDQNDEALKPWLAQGMTFIKDRVRPGESGPRCWASTSPPATC